MGMLVACCGPILAWSVLKTRPLHVQATGFDLSVQLPSCGKGSETGRCLVTTKGQEDAVVKAWCSEEICGSKELLVFIEFIDLCWQHHQTGVIGTCVCSLGPGVAR